jgi:hypothetical protein
MPYEARIDDQIFFGLIQLFQEQGFFKILLFFFDSIGDIR